MVEVVLVHGKEMWQVAKVDKACGRKLTHPRRLLGSLSQLQMKESNLAH
jgi:hypothetical protein